jgi:MFS family permease
MEVILLSFLSIVLVTRSILTPGQASLLTSLVFVGALGGTLVLGPLADRVGRRPVFALTAVIIAVFGFATSLASTFLALALIRSMVGFGVGGLTVPFDALAEFVPLANRGKYLLFVEYFWTLGTLLTPLAAYATLGGGGGNDDEKTENPSSWRWFVAVCATPCALSALVGIRSVPESPRWLLSRGMHDTALDILRQAASTNGLDPPVVFPPGTCLLPEEDHLQRCHDDNNSDDDEASRSVAGGVHPWDKPSALASAWRSLMELLSPHWMRTTLFLWLSWAGLAVCYYGTIMVTTAVFTTVLYQSASNATDDSPPPSHRWLDENFDPVTADNGNATAGYSFDYGAVTTSASAEIAGTTLVLLTIDRLGRVPSQALAYAAGGLSVFALCWVASSSSPSHEPSSRTSLVLAAFFARLCFMGATCTTWVSTAELFPTRLRTTGHATCNAVARLGGAASPLLLINFLSAAAAPDGSSSQPGDRPSSSSIRGAGIALLAVSLTTAWSTWHLPETAGRAMGRLHGLVLPVNTMDEDGVFRFREDSDDRRARDADCVS